MIRKVYAAVRKKASTKHKAVLSKLIFSLSGKPFTLKDNLSAHEKFPAAAKGGLIISADFEMAWAFRYSKRNLNPLVMADKERKNVPLILKLLEDYSIPITWATVGHLFLESCSRDAHDWMRRIPYFDDHWRYKSGDWFDSDPHGDFHKDKAWYAPDLIELILQSNVKHEFGCHTFSHIDCSDKNCPPGVLDDELKASIEAASSWGISMKSMVFPGGTAGNFDVLEKHNFVIYREHTAYDLAYPYRGKGGLLTTISTSSFGKDFEWSADYYCSRYMKMIDRAIKTNTTAHLWLHPSLDSWTLYNVLPKVLKYAADKRDKGYLWIGTMGQIADHINSRKIL